MSIRVQSVIDLNELLLSMLGMLRNSISDGIALSTILAVPIAAVRMEASAMQKAILHLAGNFHNAMPNGGCLLFETENIRFDSEEACRELGLAPGEYIRLSVSGAGADPAHIGVAPSSSGPPYCSTSLLLLAPIYALARGQGGIATIRSEPKNTTMSLYLAREPEAADKIWVELAHHEVNRDIGRPALIGPAIGIGIFFTAHSNHLGGATTLLAKFHEGGSVAVLGKDEAIKTFVPQWLLIDAFPVPAPQRMPYAVNGKAESGTWRTVVRCALGPATKDGRCPLPEASEAIADIDSPTEESNSPPLSGRMSIGGP